MPEIGSTGFPTHLDAQEIANLQLSFCSSVPSTTSTTEAVQHFSAATCENKQIISKRFGVDFLPPVFEKRSSKTFCRTIKYSPGV